ncbi:MAG TPA: SRPBCC family protein [Micromonosporaceae bacterium]
MEYEVHVDAPPDAVWALVTDIELPTRFSPELRRVRWLDDATRPEVGARFEGYNRNPVLGEWRTVSRVTELVAPTTFAWAVLDPYRQFGADAADPTPLATWRFDLTPERGGVLLRLTARLGPGRSGLNLAIDRMPEREETIVAARLADLRNGMEQTLLGIKALAERTAG